MHIGGVSLQALGIAPGKSVELAETVVFPLQNQKKGPKVRKNSKIE
jgi:hypothetical protein